MSGKKRYILLLAMLLGLLFSMGSVKASASDENVVKTAAAVSGGRFVTKTAGLKYWYAEGGYAKNIWLNIDGGIYYFNSKGVCQTGWFTYNGNTYYANKKGKIYVKKWKTSGTKKYYLRASGVMAQSQWLKISGKYYYFNAKGRLGTGKIFSVNGKYYCGDGAGARISSSWVKKNGNKYYFNASGVRVQGKWKKINGSYYYFDDDGILLTSQWIGDYYVDENGVRLTDCVVDGYTLDSDGKKVVEEFDGKYIFVGDSRVVGMASAVSDSNTIFIGKVGAGYSWLKSYASSALAAYLDEDPNAKVIFAFGINDLGNISLYITYYNTLIAKYTDTEFYMMAVNPVNETTAKKYGYSVTNTQIAAFNTKLKAAFSSVYLDTYTYLTTNGFSTSDGIHYTAATYKTIHTYVLSVIG
ncbi:MAG: hypothetical protein LUD18_14410 [Lachnospiraceae bacterium]|nr:hypothetical protein [Lachnospiraceae bacterium]